MVMSFLTQHLFFTGMSVLIAGLMAPYSLTVMIAMIMALLLAGCVVTIMIVTSLAQRAVFFLFTGVAVLISSIVTASSCAFNCLLSLMCQVYF